MRPHGCRKCEPGMRFAGDKGPAPCAVWPDCRAPTAPPAHSPTRWRTRREIALVLLFSFIVSHQIGTADQTLQTTLPPVHKTLSRFIFSYTAIPEDIEDDRAAHNEGSLLVAAFFISSRSFPPATVLPVFEAPRLLLV
jgi:hypothetical protein